MKTWMARLLDGAKAGIVGTLAMSSFMALAKAAGVLGEPPPMKLTRRLTRRIGLPEPKGAELVAASALAHLGFGALSGAAFSTLPFERRTTPLLGATFGLAVWALSYAGWIPRFSLMPPPSRDRPGRPTAMIAAHLLYGATLAAILRRSARARR